MQGRRCEYSFRNIITSHRFLDGWYAGDYPTAFEFLHRYYDYALQNRDRSQYQYALLNMAILQADFGCYPEAVAAMDETIGTARENKDTACLNFSLSWLYHFRTVFGAKGALHANQVLADSDSKSLAFLRARAFDSKMWVVATSTVLSQARLAVSMGRDPAEAFTHVYESFHLVVQHNLLSSMGAQLLEQSSIFARLGICSLSQSHCRLIGDCYLGDVLTGDSLRARCRNAHAANSAGDYKKAGRLLSTIGSDVHQNMQLNQFVSMLSNILRLKQMLHRNDLLDAELLLKSLKHSPCIDPELQFQVSMLELDYFTRIGDFEKAHNLIHSFLSRPPASLDRGPTQDVYHRIRMITAKANLISRFKGPPKALSLALRAVIAAMRAKILPAMWEATVPLAEALTSINEQEQAINLLQSIIWQVSRALPEERILLLTDFRSQSLIDSLQASETEDLQLMAQLQNTHANACVSLAGRTGFHRASRDTWLTQALNWIDRAYDSYRKLEDVKGARDASTKAYAALRLLGNEHEASEKLKLAESLDSKIEV